MVRNEIFRFIFYSFLYQIKFKFHLSNRKMEELKNSKIKNLFLSNCGPYRMIYICFVFGLLSKQLWTSLNTACTLLCQRCIKMFWFTRSVNCSTDSSRTPNGLRNLSWGNYRFFFPWNFAYRELFSEKWRFTLSMPEFSSFNIFSLFPWFFFFVFLFLMYCTAIHKYFEWKRKYLVHMCVLLDSQQCWAPQMA